MSEDQTRVSTGVPGLDEILGGGLPINCLYLLEGAPGAGKTTLGLHFLREGVRQGERVLYITLLHAKRELELLAAAHGWDLAGMDVASMTAVTLEEAKLAEQTVFPTSEVQLTNVMDAMREAVDRVKPSRVFFDSIDQFRLLAGDPVVYRQKVLAVQRMLEDRNITGIFVDSTQQSLEFKTMVHGSIVMDSVVPSYGEMRRRIRVEKIRSIAFAGGYHSFRIRAEGLEVFPRLPIASRAQEFKWTAASSGIAELDELLGGGLEYGTSCLITGQAGTGKTTLATAYAYAAAKLGNRSVVLLFDESLETFIRRSVSLGMDLPPLLENGMMIVQQVNVGDLSSGELNQNLRAAVEKHGAKVLVIDSLTGYAGVLADEPQLLEQLHEMLTYLHQKGVMSLITVTEHGLITVQRGEVDASYIADCIVLMRHFEARGAIHVAMSVIKKRHGKHEKTIRELKISSEGGLVVGKTLEDFQGVLTGEPEFVGEASKLME